MNLYFLVRDLLSRKALTLPSRLVLFPLTALAWLYGRLQGLRRWAYRAGLRKGYRAGVPVISVGNVTVGGTGKTPCVEAVCRILVAEGIRPAVLSRGYGVNVPGGAAVVSDGQKVFLDSRTAGDEPVLMAQSLPGVAVLVGPDRRVTAREAVDRLGAEALILDDGFQHLRIARDLDIVTVDVRNPLGNGHCLPRGLLRERPDALGDADVILITRVSGGERGRAEGLRERIRRYNRSAPVLPSGHAPVRVVDLCSGSRRLVRDLEGMKVLAFAGIGNPAAFFQDLAALGARVLEGIPFPDHRVYTRSDLEKLLEWAKLMHADAVITTEKDAVRLVPLLPVDATVLALGVELELLEGEEAFREVVVRVARRR